MDIKLLDYIQELSLKDKKDLSQKGLKAGEEFGELAKAILPYVSAPGSKHRFVDKYKILDCVADNILTALSVAYDIGFNHEEIENMIHRKSMKWEELQIDEETANFPVPYEIHITVECQDFSDSFMARFKSACEEIRVKSIVLNLENSSSIMKDVMTSSKFRGDNTTVYKECCRIKNELMLRGFKVVREKIESAPWHPGAPKKIDDIMPENCYFESHVAVEMDGTEDAKFILQNYAFNHNAHLSKNTFKKFDNGKYIQMLTLRNYKTTREKFELDVQNLINDLNKSFSVSKTEVEFCVYDSKINHDYKWLNNENKIMSHEQKK